MIGRSLVIFQRGNNKNELHEVNSWEFALGCRDEEFKKKVVAEAKKKKWKPEEIVDDAEVEAIVNATNCIGSHEPGYHKWASDGVSVINLSDDPNLYNPAAVKAEKRRKEEDKWQKALKKLNKFIPELVKLRNAVPTGSITVNVVLPLIVKVDYSVSQAISSVGVLDKQDKKLMWANEVIDREALAKMPGLADIVNCPHRKAYQDRCQEIANLLGLSETDVENATYYKILGWKGEGKKK